MTEQINKRKKNNGLSINNNNTCQFIAVQGARLTLPVQRHAARAERGEGRAGGAGWQDLRPRSDVASVISIQLIARLCRPRVGDADD